MWIMSKKMERKRINYHKENICQMRIIICNNCHGKFRCKDFAGHFCKDKNYNYNEKTFDSSKKKN